MRTGSILGLTAVAGMASIAGVPAVVSGATGGDLTALTHGSSLPASCDVAAHPQRGAAVEPDVTSSPLDRSQLIAAWQADRLESGGATALGIAISSNGGRSWRRAKAPGTTSCPRAPADRTSDPWVSIGGDGTAYISSVPGHLGPDGTPVTAVKVSHSTDGGKTWSAPVTVADDGALNDKETVTADPYRPRTAYAVWTKNFRFVYFSRTTDRGITWTRQRNVPLPGVRPTPYGNVISVLRDGTLVDVFVGGHPPIRIVYLIRSRNGGDTWSAPVKIASMPQAAPGPPGRRGIRAVPAPSVAVGENVVYVAWPALPRRGDSSIRIARSGDGGASWSVSTVAHTPGSLILPALAIRSGDTLGLTYYALARRRGRAGTIHTQIWFATSHDQGRSWHRTPVGAPFDFARAVLADRNLFLGDYTGLASTARGFTAVVAATTRETRRARSDIFAARLSG